jgi:hypothetical protein
MAWMPDLNRRARLHLEVIARLKADETGTKLHARIGIDQSVVGHDMPSIEPVELAGQNLDTVDTFVT